MKAEQNEKDKLTSILGNEGQKMGRVATEVEVNGLAPQPIPREWIWRRSEKKKKINYQSARRSMLMGK